MRVFLYEFVTGGGWWEISPRAALEATLLAEGQAMIQALATDFAALPGCHVLTTLDARLPPLHPPTCAVTPIASAAAEGAAIAELSAQADWTLLIAPESNGMLFRRSQAVVAAGGRLLSPSPQLVALATNKQDTAERLAAQRVATPRGVLVAPGDVPHFPNDAPRVIKPVDGCGSQGVRLIQTPRDWTPAPAGQRLRCEEFVPGQAASVAVLCGPAKNFSLPACTQRLTTDGTFQYLGGSLPLPAALDRRARGLAEAAAAALPEPFGYLGVDLVLGDAEDGSGDRVIEINPRLTTSYVGLRAAARHNLAGAMLAVANGQPPQLHFDQAPIEFRADGRITLGTSR